MSRRPFAWEKAIIGSQSARDAARRATSALEDHAYRFLKPGLWTLYSYGRPPLQQHIVAHESVPTSFLLLLSEGAVPHKNVNLVRLRHPETDSPFGRATILMEAENATLLISHHLGVVIRRSRTPLYNARYHEYRQKFGAFVPSVGLRATLDHATICEEFLPQKTLRNSSIGTLMNLGQRLLLCLGDLAESERVRHHEMTSSWTERRLAFTLGVGSELVRDIMNWLGDSYFAPSHGDLHLGNILDSFGHPVCIDFDWIAQRPAWLDGILFATSLARIDLQHLELVADHLENLIWVATGKQFPSNWRPLVVYAATTADAGHWKMKYMEPLAAQIQSRP